jgi:hypothetical protein
MRAGFRRVLQTVGLVALGAVGLWLCFGPQLRALWDPGLRVYAHNGEWVPNPNVVLPSFSGQPADFESRGMPLIEIPDRLAVPGREMLVAGPGCGLLRGKLGDSRITLPPPIEVTIRVSGDFALPSGDHGIMLDFHASGVRPEVASVVEGVTVPSGFWSRPERSWPWAEQIWLDPATRSASVLLPCTGTWRVTWTHTTRPEPGKFQSFGIVFGTGESTVNVAKDGEEHTIEIDPEEMDTFGVDDH